MRISLVNTIFSVKYLLKQIQQKLIYNLKMIEIQEIRRKNLKSLAAEFKAQGQSMPNVTEINKSYLSQMLNGYPIGEKTARKIEKAAGKPELWLDQEDTLSAEHRELIRRIEEFPDEHLHVLSAFVDSLSQIDKKNQ